MSELRADMRPAWRSYWLGIMLAVLLGFSSLGGGEAGAINLAAALVIIGLVIVKRFSWRYTIEGDRVRRHWGIIARNQQGLRIADLRSVEFSQGPVQRMLGIGDLAFYSAGSGSAEVTFRGIIDPAGWRDRIDSAIDDQKARAA